MHEEAPHMGGHTGRKRFLPGYVKWAAVAAGVVIGMIWGFDSFRGSAAPDVIQEETGSPLPENARVIEARCERGSGGILAEVLDRLLARERPSRPIRIPLSCVHRMGYLEIVRVVEGGRVFSRLVKTGGIHNGSVEILSGLRSGERVLLPPPAGE
jgi:hypothetical protein